MSILEIFILALIQGFTEFLPVSSSAHLILPSQILGWNDQGLAFDVAVHIGTLLAVVIYFRKEVFTLLGAWGASFTGKHNGESRLAWFILLGSIPLGLAGFLGKDFIELYLRSAWVIAASTIIFGLLLWWVDVKAKQVKDEYELTLSNALFIGLSQAIALIPGTSRSGITMTAGLMLGMTRESAARYSFLLSIPAIIMSGGYMALGFLDEGVVVNWSELGYGAILSFVSAYLCITFFLKVISKMGMLPFVIYRLLLGAGLIIFLSV
ncbi:undecaprenyl-diphosphate phosphatase [Psychrobium sp. MM17-31]|uniref:undecaprenyl-diphosphate phosphatase n=1 Tax=Psychrobium sp. MM17-31 TaxID=2917758 RepID=UPI001EF5C4EF|nr:undecaprenyl-diphosphate phosphatase [Psychrobium sp. MM17-31]MCG7532341.1 undecaprenyl-diphosphate phosphatase [Psychrobium sp. MM17-31]